MPPAAKYEYRICVQNDLAGIEQLVRQRQQEGFEIHHDCEHVQLDECFKLIDEGKKITVSMRRRMAEVSHETADVS